METPVQKAIDEMTRRFLNDEMEFKDGNHFYSFREYLRSLETFNNKEK